MMKPNHLLSLSFVLLLLILSSRATFAQETWISLEGGAVVQTQNEVQIPSDTGTRFSLTDLGRGPAAAGRIYLGYQLDDRHELRGLYAPLELQLSGELDKEVHFSGQTFSAQTPTTALYRFNSYRLTYRYTFYQSASWLLKAGFTAKIRDAEIRLRQGAVVAASDNVGFVPLLHFAAQRKLGRHWNFLVDLDALAAPQGRAEDLALFIQYLVSDSTSLAGGYRTVEGGSAGGGGVYNFAWLHFLALSGTYTFYWVGKPSNPHRPKHH